MLQGKTPSRRLSSRVGAAQEVWVLWRCKGTEDISRIGDLSTGGVFLRGLDPKPVGHSFRLDFLVQEGEIRADAEVRHAERGAGLGLKFLALNDQGKMRLEALVARLRGLTKD